MLSSGWMEIAPNEGIRQQADRLVSQHPLSAADGFQLAAALHGCAHEPQGSGFVCLDRRLREAALREGFQVLPD